MKISIALSVLILAIGLTIGFLHQKQLATLGADRDELAAKAVAMGLSTDLPDSSGNPKITKRQREDRENRIRAVVADVAAYSREMEAWEENGGNPDSALEKRAFDILSQLESLDSDQLKTLIAGLKNDPTLTEKTRRYMIGISLISLAERYPKDALALFAGPADLMSDDDLSKKAVSSALEKWAQDDPRAALKWLQENSQKHPELIDDDTASSVLAGAAQNDPKLAFKLMGELAPDDASESVKVIAEAAKTPEQRSATLAAFREYLATVEDSSERDDLRGEALGGLARTIEGENFDSVASWVADQKLTPEENDRFVAGLSYDTTLTETGKWIDWMAKTFPPEKLGKHAGDLVGQWTQQDYQAAGKWLAAEPDGPAKSASVRSYAVTVAEYEPQIATQWALTLPAGEERNATLKSIYENWPKSDAAAAAAFAAQYGISAAPIKEEP